MEKARLMGEDGEEITLEEKIEEERAALPSTGLTPVTLESFKEWKIRKAERKQKELEDRMKEEAKKAGSKGGSNILSGRALFKYDPTLFKDDEEAALGDIYEERNEDEEEKKQEEYKASDFVKNKNQEEIKEETPVDADLFSQEVNAEEEEPDFE